MNTTLLLMRYLAVMVGPVPTTTSSIVERHGQDVEARQKDEHDGIWTAVVFMGSGLAAERRPGMTASASLSHGDQTAAFLIASSVSPPNFETNSFSTSAVTILAKDSRSGFSTACIPPFFSAARLEPSVSSFICR